jgi:hypothetical protein
VDVGEDGKVAGMSLAGQVARGLGCGVVSERLWLG